MTQKEWLTLAIFTFLIVLVWTTMEIYHIYTTSTITDIDQSLIQPLNSRIDHNTVIRLLEENY